MSFKDHFSEKSKAYAKARPTYPVELYRYLADISPGNKLALDCATGSGQAAIGLASFFDKIIATDASEQQIEHAIPHPNVDYRVALAENSGLRDNSVDLVTVGTALHWFKLEEFYREVGRILKPGGVLAAFGYGFLDQPPEVARLVNEFAGKTVLDYWPPEAIVNWKDRYRSLSFPFPEIDAPAFHIDLEWNVNQLKEFISSWSAVMRYHNEHGQAPTGELFQQLIKKWGEPDTLRTVVWPLHMRIGRKEAAS